MKLVKCYVSAFGKLQDFTYDFNSNLNVINEDNGWGKTTFATFIKSMFYGLKSSARSVAENERMKYRPWNSSLKFGGYVVFEWADKEFKLERFFGAKESEDSVKLFDNLTGKEYSNTADLGRRIFEIDEEGFLSTTYFSQKDIQAKSNTSLTAKFNKVCEVQDTELFDKALTKLVDKAKSFEKTGGKGLIPDAQKEIFDINEQLLKTEKDLEILKKLRFEIDDLNKEIQEIESKLKVVEEKLEVASKLEALSLKKAQYQKLVLEKEKLESTLSSAKEFLNGNEVDVKTVQKLQEENLELYAIDAKIKGAEDDLALLQNEYTPKKVKDNSKAKKLSLLGLSVAVILSLILTFAWEINSITIGFYVLSVIFGLAYLFDLKSPKQEQVNPIHLHIEKKRAELNEFLNQKTLLETQIDGYISNFGFAKVDNRATALSNIIDVWKVYLDVRENLQTVQKELLAFNKEEIKAQIDNSIDAQGLKIEQLRLSSTLKERLKMLEAKRASIKIYEVSTSAFPDLESRKAELQQKILDYKEEQKIYKHTVEFLKKADENLKIKYRAPLQNSLKKYFDYIDSNNKVVNIDVDLKVTVEEKGQQMSTDYYSKGYQNLFEICKRFALVDVLFTGEKPFIILDDPFYNLDEKKLTQAVELIKKLSEDYQILYLICHDSRGV